MKEKAGWIMPWSAAYKGRQQAQQQKVTFAGAVRDSYSWPLDLPACHQRQDPVNTHNSSISLLVGDINNYLLGAMCICMF